MSAINNLNEAWNGHTGLEVESFIKQKITEALESITDKVGFIEFTANKDLVFRNEEGGAVIATVPLGGDMYSITVTSNFVSPFYVLADEPEKIMTISASTTVGELGSQDVTDYPESYIYEVWVNSGNGYSLKISGNINQGASVSFNILPYLATGNNFIKIAVSGASSGQVKTVVYTAILTTMSLSCNHTWQDVWNQGSPYVINRIRFAGSVQKTLHISLDNVEIASQSYSPNQSYTTSATTITLPANKFPDIQESGVHTLRLWLTASGVSTQVISYNIMCVVEEDTTPLLAINNVVDSAVNFTSGRLFSYAVYNADSASFDIEGILGVVDYEIADDIEISNLEPGVQYAFTYPLEIDTGENTTTTGTITFTGTPYLDSTASTSYDSVTTVLDNTFSYLAESGATFYLNAASRSNNDENRQAIINLSGESLDHNFDATYAGTWTGFSWNGDGWATDDNGYKALVAPAGSSLTMDLNPLFLLSNYPSGLTIEMMIKCSNPADYETPVFSFMSEDQDPVGIAIYPTKIVVLGSNERSEILQSVNLSENTMTHLVVTFTKSYEGNNSRNLVSVYVNGISNVNFSFDGSSFFGTDDVVFKMGQQNTDAYLYKMRIYTSALSSRGVFNNFLNCIIDGVEFVRRSVYDKNDILDGDAVDYRAVKEAGYNTMIVIMDDPTHPLPSILNQTSYKHCSLKFEHADHPERNLYIQDIALDGQGTTSKKYFRWNLRAKTGDDTKWFYGNNTTETPDATGKTGYFAGTEYAKCDRITAKKNYASSMQGHKMGFTGLYNDLFHQLGFGSELPSSTTRVAVYQFPFVGFLYNPVNDTYQYIGIYTAGPDKGSKVTFGYKNLDYLLSIEGPNHAPRGTRFLHPWVDVDYDYQNETLTFGDEEGWDCDAIGGGLTTDDAGDQAAILALYEAEWKPAYNIVFNCSPYIVSAAEMITALNNPSITTIADLTDANNSDVILAGTTNGFSNLLLSFYDSSYELYFYRTKTSRFEKLVDIDSTCEHNVVTYLYANNYLDTQSPTTAQIIAARVARFKAEAEDYWYMDQTLYHYAFCVLFGVSDNFAKNSYPQKFRQLSDNAAGNRWGWREDDMDTVMSTDNNGQNTKRYDVEPGDTILGVEVFQGGNSALWVLIRDYYQDEVRRMMVSLVNAAATIATSLTIQGDGLHNSLFNLVSYYCWENSAKYFSATLYETDRRWSYIEPWLRNAQQTYNNVYPLTQALGDQYQGEKLWMERRIAYIFSKYRVGVFSGDVTTESDPSFTLGDTFTFNLKPAITLYPVISLANTVDRQGNRTQAGQTSTITVTGDGQTTNYIHGGNWLSSFGDLSGMVLTSRGGASDIPLSISGNRLHDLTIGNANSSAVKFNATSLSVASPTIVEIDARNTTTIRNSIDLLNCPRLRTVKFAGSGASGLLLPVGGKVTEVSFPSSASTVFMHSLPYLQNANLTLPDLANITTLYINNCANVNPLAIVGQIMGTQNNRLSYATLIWNTPVDATQAMLDALFGMSSLNGSVTYGDEGLVLVTGLPHIEGPLTASLPIAISTYEIIDRNYPLIQKNFDKTKVYFDFEDSNVESVLLTNYDTNSSGTLTLDEVESITNFHNIFNDNSSITKFNELKYFKGITSLTGDSYQGTFKNCSSLVEVTLPAELEVIGWTTFLGATSLKTIHLSENNNIREIAYGAFGSDQSKNTSCQLFDDDLYFPKLQTLGQSAFAYTGIKKVLSLGSITELPGNTFRGCTSLKEIHLPSSVITAHRSSLGDCTAIETLIAPGLKNIALYAYNTSRIPDNVTAFASVEQVGSNAFANTTGDTISFPNLKGWSNIDENGNGTNIFNDSRVKHILSLGSVTTIPNLFCVNNSALEDVHIPSTVTSIGTGAFHNCTSLKQLNNIANAPITTIGENAFNNAGPIEYLSFPSLQQLNGEAIFRQSKIKSIDSLGSISSIPNWCFASCDKLEDPIYIPDTVAIIGENAFYNCKTNIITSNNSIVSTLGSGAFQGSNIEEVNLPQLTTISNNNVFSFCTSLTKIKSLGFITAIPNSLFQNATSLTEVILPASLTSIGNNAFYGCSSLTTINTNGAHITTIGSEAFRGCPIETDINYPYLTSVGQYAFDNSHCEKVLSLGSITSISGALFWSCNNMKLLTLPSTLQTIGENPFWQGGNSLVCVISNATTPPSMVNNWPNYNGTLTVKVPATNISSYVGATNWTNHRIVTLDTDTSGVCNNLWFTTNKTETSNGYAITTPINITGAHQYMIDLQVTPTSGKGCILLYDNNGYLSRTISVSTAITNITAFPAESTIRLSVSMAKLKDCSVYDETASEYVWQGSSVNRFYCSNGFVATSSNGVSSSTYSNQTMRVGDNGKWMFGNHIDISTQAGNKYLLKLESITLEPNNQSTPTTGSYSFTTSNWGNEWTDVGYITESPCYNVSVGEYVEVTIPTSATYLILETKHGDDATYVWSIWDLNQ